MRASIRLQHSKWRRNYISGITVPDGALDRWYAYRTPAQTAAARRSVVVFGDSTTFGSGPDPLYSWMQRLRDRAVGSGLADGGKGMFGGVESQLGYDSPEVNGVVSATASGTPDSFDTLGGQYFTLVNSGETVVLQFRSTAFRLWYVKRASDGTFTYAVNGGSAVTVNANQSGDATDHFVYVSGLAASTTHTITIARVTGTSHVAFAPVNEVGVSLQKHATSGGTFTTHFHQLGITGYHHATRYQAPLGLVPTTYNNANSPRSVDNYVAGNTLDTSYAADARINPVLAILDYGFNDLTSQANTDYSVFSEAVRKFGAACRAAGCDGLVLSGQLPYNANWPTYGAGVFAALRDTAAAQGLAFADFFIPVGGPSLSYSFGSTNPHLTKAQYQAQADWLWDNLLGV